MFQTFPKTRLLNLPIGLILFSNIIAIFTAVTSAYKSAVFRRDPMSFFANAVISFSLTFVTAYTKWLFSPRALRCRKVPEGERIVSAARNCVILYCTLGLGFLVNTILGKIDRTFYVFIFDADWIRSMFSQQCSGTLHFQCCKWTFRFSEKMMFSSLSIHFLINFVIRRFYSLDRPPEGSNQKDVLADLCKGKTCS